MLPALEGSVLRGHRLHDDLDALVTAVHEFFAGLPPQAVLRLAAWRR